MRRRLCLNAGLGLLLPGCAVQQMPGYQNSYQRYQIPDALWQRMLLKLAEYGLTQATLERDNVGRARLTGRYRNEDEVERAFLIVQSIVGLRSTSPLYPEQVDERRWEQEAGRAMAEHAQALRERLQPPPRKRGLVVGINDFMDSRHLHSIQGEDDARLVRDQLLSAGYQVNALLGRQATRAAIESALQQLQAELGARDSLFVYISSHGNPPVPSPRGRDERRMSIAAYDSGDANGRSSRDATDFLLRLQASSVKDSQVQALALQPSRITRVFIDTCYSGEMLKDLPEDSRDYILARNGGEVERATISLSAWGGTAQRPNYQLITATSEGQASLGPPVAAGVFASPVNPQRLLRGSYFTQAFFDYLALHQGRMQAAFEAAREFTERKVQAVSGGRLQQVPRQFSTVAEAENNLYR